MGLKLQADNSNILIMIAVVSPYAIGWAIQELLFVSFALQAVKDNGPRAGPIVGGSFHFRDSAIKGNKDLHFIYEKLCRGIWLILMYVLFKRL